MVNTTLPEDLDQQLERIVSQRTSLRLKHTQALTRLLEERADLRGVYPLADLVTDSLRWSA